MSKTLERTFEIESSPRSVMDAMRDPELIQKSERSRDALEVEITDVEKTETRHRYVVRTVTYARSVKGIDRSKTEENRTTVSWDIENQRADWSWSGAHGDKVKVEGHYRIVPNGEGAKLTLDTTIDVRIPVVGRVVESKIKDGFDDAWPRYVALVGNHARTLPKPS